MPRPLLLNGFMATGKSTLGRRVAELEGVPFEDLDDRVERRAGQSVSEIFQTAGEDEFRRLERLELEAVLRDPSRRVVALGGGALLDRELRLLALERATVVTLEAPIDVVMSRASATPRPLLAGADPQSRARALLESRCLAYAEAHARIPTAELDVEASAQAIRAVWQREPVAVALGQQSYGVDIGSGVLDARLPVLVGEPTAVLVVSDSNVSAAHGPALSRALPGAATLVLAAGEQNKTPAALEQVWRAARQHDLDRGSLFVAFGGGVVCDIAGFAAATWMRGTRWLALPTTLLSMLDASVGGKTAVDLGDAKNAVGAFWQPAGVVCDIALLGTEPDRGFRAALSEAVKSALVGDAELLDFLESHADALLRRDPSALVQVVRRSVSVKARVVARDERESGLRAVLNLGHTVGHALEACTGYREYTHGEAVSLGLVAALGIGQRLGVTSSALAARVTALLARLGLPTDLAAAPVGEAVDLLARDKKRRGTYIHFVLVSEPGRVETKALPLEQLRRLVQSA